MKRKRLFATGLTLACFALPSAGAQDDRAASAPEDLYPKLLAFRVSEGLKTEQDYAPFALYDFIHGGGNPDYIRKYNPDAPVVAHWRLGLTAKPGVRWGRENDIRTRLGQELWPGHWLLYNGTKLTRALDADAGASTIHVENVRVFQNPKDSPKEFGPDDVQIYALDEAGRPVWDRSEQVRLRAIDPKSGTIVVERGQYLSMPLAFEAGRAVAAVHARTPFLFGPDPKCWRVNMTLSCPKDPQGRTGAEVSGRMAGQTLLANDTLSGAEFDVGEWNLHSKTTTKDRSFDGDNDLKGDECYVERPGLGVVNEHGLGLVLAIKAMRDVVGPGKIIQADDGLRAYPYLNGSEWEFYPGTQSHDPRIASSVFDHLRYVLSRSPYAPRISYLMVKRPTDRYTDVPEKKWGDNWPRMGVASAAMVGAYYTYNSVNMVGGGKAPVGLGFGRFYPWDEYNGGRLDRKRYLGRALGEFQRLAGQTGDASVLAPFDGVEADCKEGYAGRAERDGEARVLRLTVERQPIPPRNGGVEVRLAPRSGLRVERQAAFTLRGEVRALTPYGRIDPALADVPSFVMVGLNKETPQRNRLAIVADRHWRPFSISLYADAAFEGLTISLGEEPGVFEFRDLEMVEGDEFVLWRRFEDGVALLNGTARPVTFDLAKVDPERRYRAIDGVITPEVNDGRPVDAPITVPPFDGRILLTR